MVALYIIIQWVAIIWFVKNATERLNPVQVEGDKEFRDPIVTVLLCLFCPFYSLYWIYKMCKKIDVLIRNAGKNDEITTLCTIVGIFIPIVSFIVMYMKMNEVCENAMTPPLPTFSNGATSGTASGNTKGMSSVDVVEDLKKYKELLDMGILTPEEFEAKKKQLLDLI